jgi:ComF family protein
VSELPAKRPSRRAPHHRVVHAIASLVARTLDQVLPPLCPGCGREGFLLCSRCASPLQGRLDQPPGQPLGLEAEIPRDLVQLEWCSPFTGPVRASLHALKYDGVRALAAPLGTAMAARWRAAGGGGDRLIPVPAHDERVRERGYDQTALLAAVLGRDLELPVVPALVRTRATHAQHALGRAARATNVGHRFAVPETFRAHVAGHWPVLVDDVVTTGATLSACARALMDAGAIAVSALTVAREG